MLKLRRYRDELESFDSQRSQETGQLDFIAPEAVI